MNVVLMSFILLNGYYAVPKSAVNYTVFRKIGTHLFFAITFPNMDRF